MVAQMTVSHDGANSMMERRTPGATEHPSMTRQGPDPANGVGAALAALAEALAEGGFEVPSLCPLLCPLCAPLSLP